MRWCLFPKAPATTGNAVLPFKSALVGAAEARLADGRHVKVQPVSTAFTGLHGLPMGRENRPLRLVWRHGDGAAPVGGAAGRAAGCGGPVPPTLRAWT